MTNPTPRDSAQLPPLRKLTEDELSTLHDNPNTSDVEQLVYDYAREALRAQAASVVPVAWWRISYVDEQGDGDADVNVGARHPSELGLSDNGFPWEPLYAGAPPAPVSVQDEALVEKLAKRTCEANADAARFTIALQPLRASLDPDDWMGPITMHGYIDAVLAGGSPLQQHPAPSPVQAVIQVGCENIHPETEACSICEPAQAVDAVSLRFRKKPVVIEASQWFKNGDHPLDYSRTHQCLENGQLRDFQPQERQANEWEGDVVRYYRTPSLDGKQACKHCGKIMHEHGWIDTLEGGHIVCPGDWIITGVAGEHYPCKPDIFAKTYEPAELATAGESALIADRDALRAEVAKLMRVAPQASRQPQAQQGGAAPLELKVCHSQNASQTPQTDLSLMAAPQEWSPAYTRGPSRQSAPVTAVPAMVPLTEEQMVSAVRPLCNTDQVAERLVAVSVDEYRAIEAAIAKINGLTVGDGAQPIKGTP